MSIKSTLLKGKDEPTNDPAWADVALNYLDDFIAENGPFYAMLGYSQGQFFKSLIIFCFFTKDRQIDYLIQFSPKHIPRQNSLGMVIEKIFTDLIQLASSWVEF